MPMVVIPMFADQPDNAKRVEEAGAGVAVFEPEVSLIKAAIERVLTDNEMRESAGQIAKEMASTTSLSEAVDQLLSPLKN